MLGANNPINSIVDVAHTASAVTSILPVVTPQTMPPPSGSPALNNLLYSWQGTAMLAVLAAAGLGVAGTYGAVKYVMSEYEKGVEGKFIDKIDKITALYKAYLTNIPVHGNHTQISLPPIFSKTEVADGKKIKFNVDAIHFPDEVILKKGNNIPQQTARGLSQYKECIYNAIQQLKTYYFSLPDAKASKDPTKADVRKKNGIARALISYLIEMLDSHCLNFQGYDYDIAVLGRIGTFIEKFASDASLHEKRDVSHLQKVFPWVDKAKGHLEKHQKMLNLQEIGSELFSKCRDASDDLLKTYAKLTCKIDRHKDMKFLIKDTIAKEKIQLHYIKDSYFWGLFDTHTNEVKIYESLFRQNLVDHAKYAINVIDTDLILTEQDIPLVEIALPDHERLIELENKNKLTKAEEEEKKGLENQFKHLAKMFDECRNFITTKSIQKPNKDPQYIPFTIKERELLIERSRIIIDIAKLINEIVTLQYYVNNLGKALESLGEIAITSEKNKQVFDVITGTLTKINESVEDLNKRFTQIQEFNEHSLAGEYADVRDDLKDNLDRIKTFITAAQTRITNYWKNNESKTEELEEKAKADLYNTTDLVDKVLNLNVKKKYEVPKLNMSDNIDNNPASIYFDKVLTLDTARKEGTLRAKKEVSRESLANIDWNQEKTSTQTVAWQSEEITIKSSSKVRRLSRRNSTNFEKQETQDESVNKTNSKKERRGSDSKKERRRSTGSFGNTKLGQIIEKRLSSDKYDVEAIRTATSSVSTQPSFNTAEIQKLLPKSMPGRLAQKNAEKEPEEKQNEERSRSRSPNRRIINLEGYSNDNLAEVNQGSRQELKSSQGISSQPISAKEDFLSRIRLKRRSSSLIRANENLKDEPSAREEVEASPEAINAKLVSKYYERLDVVGARLKNIDDNIKQLTDTDENGIYSRLSASLNEDYKKLRDLMADRDRGLVDRNGKMDEMLPILEGISKELKFFLNANITKETRTENIAILTGAINKLISTSSNAVFIDKYKPGLKGWLYSLFWNTDCRDKLLGINKVCEDLNKLTPSRLLTMI